MRVERAREKGAPLNRTQYSSHSQLHLQDAEKDASVTSRNFERLIRDSLISTKTRALYLSDYVAAVAGWYRYRTVACPVTSSSPVPLKTRRVGQRCMLNLSRAETSSRWCGVVVRRGGASSGVVHVT
ncbi:uncharacterized protein TNCV_3139711 [Trichonephila clavipes]|nr:uncharacterized protein TNCV_3139711 [Trichonephila clavipes]